MNKETLAAEFFVKHEIKQSGQPCEVAFQVVSHETDIVIFEVSQLVNDISEVPRYQDALKSLLFEHGRIYNALISFLTKRLDIDIEGKSLNEVLTLIQHKTNEDKKGELKNVI